MDECLSYGGKKMGKMKKKVKMKPARGMGGY